MKKITFALFSLFATPVAAQDLSAAQIFLADITERSDVWVDHGRLYLPSKSFFIGDPTSGRDHHMRATGTIETSEHRFMALDGPNYLISREHTGNPPMSKGAELRFSVEAATFAFGDIATGRTFANLTEIELDAGRGDSFDWIMPHIHATPHFAKWLDVPPNDAPMFVASRSNDDGLSAAWHHDDTDAVSGILIDIAGHVSDGGYVDKFLPLR